MAIVLLIAFVIAIAIGFKTNINQGIIAMIISYFLGCFAMGLKPNALTAMWPMRIFFILVFVSLFYNFATLNGTMDKLALNILYKFGKQARLLPFVAFAAACIMSVMGAGPYAVIVLLCPILFIICDKVNMSKLMLGVAAYLGAVSSSAFPTCSTGAVINGIIVDIGYQEQAMTYSLTVVIFAFLGFLLAFTLMYFFVFKGHKVSIENILIEKPEPYDEKQKKSLTLIILFMVTLLVPYILAIPFDNAVVNALVSYNDVAFIAMIFAAISWLLKLADEKKVITSVPWNTVIMVGGISIIVGLAVEAGTIDLLVNVVNSTGNVAVVPGLMSLIASCMSLFSSTTGVVIPTLYPMVPDISSATGISAPLLLAAINNGSGIVGMSPLSACGALIMGCVSEKDVGPLYKRLFLVAGGCLAFSFAMFLIVGLVL